MRQTVEDDIFFDAGQAVGVLTAQPIDRMLDYLAPEGGVFIGAFVEVPLGRRMVVGVVWGTGTAGLPKAKLRTVARVLAVAPMRAELRAFLERAGRYTLTPMHAMLRLATRLPKLNSPPPQQKLYRIAERVPLRMNAARARVLDCLHARGDTGLTLGELTAASGAGAGVVRGLVACGAVAVDQQSRDQPYPRLDPDRNGKSLSRDQARAAQNLIRAVDTAAYGASLLHGVTGSGKTEVYLEAIAACLRRGRQALVLLPEIALTAEFVARVEMRFGARPAEWHSGIGAAERRRLWHMLGQGQAQLVIGARSALFLPFRDLGLIVVDEEHDGSYKQEEGVFYNARDMAVLRASICRAHVVLASATPSLESWVNAKEGKYNRLDLPARFGTARLPRMTAIDMRGTDLPRGRWISPPLQAAIRQRLQDNAQSLLFLNRRGYAPVTLCRACGHQLGCAHCDARLVEHRFRRMLMCHQCGAEAKPPRLCPACGAKDQMSAIGPGVERLADEAALLFPDARLSVLSSDMFGSADALTSAIATIAKGGADIVIGTQLVAKGHNFPRLTLVGVIDADLGLQGSDLRAAEKTFQLVRQVAGRAGRAETEGLALIQTHQPDHPVIQAVLKGDQDAFLHAESAVRRAAGAPPFGRFAAVILTGPEPGALFDLGNRLARADTPLRTIGAEVFGPAPAPIARIRGKHRVRMLIRAGRKAPLQRAIRTWLSPLEMARGMRLVIDIDPQGFL